MKKILLLLALVIIALEACKSGPPIDAIKQARTDDSLIKVYLSNNPLIKAVKDSSGLYYQVTKEGNGAYATQNSTVTVNYRGELINGPQFDAANGFSTPLSNLVKAWQIGIPHVKAGGSILLIAPSALGYGSANLGPIPANSVLLFDIDVIAVK